MHCIINMLTQTLYICSTGSILTGTILSFNKDSIPDYFFLIGTSLFFIKASIHFVRSVLKKNNNIDGSLIYPEIVY